jgi:hypothetical protein
MKVRRFLPLLGLACVPLFLGAKFGRTDVAALVADGKIAAIGAPMLLDLPGKPGAYAPAIERICQQRKLCSTGQIVWMQYGAHKNWSGSHRASATRSVPPSTWCGATPRRR